MSEPLVEVAQDLARDMLSTSLVMIDDARGSGEHDMAGLAGREKSNNPLLQVTQNHVETRTDDAAPVQSKEGLGVVDALQGITQNTVSDHLIELGGTEIYRGGF